MNETTLKKFLVGAVIEDIALHPEGDGLDPHSVHIFCSNGATFTVTYLEDYGLEVDILGPGEC